MPSLNPLGQLRRLDKSSPGFHDQLSHVLYGEEYKKWVPSIDGDDLVWLVDYLDKALDSLNPASSGSRKCLRELRSICGTHATLPTSYMLSGSLQGVGGLPFTPGGSSDVYEGVLSGRRVSIKRVRVYAMDGARSMKTLYQEAVVWKRLEHQNIVPFLGITSTPLQLVSEWMPGGGLAEYIKRNPDADRLVLLSDVADGLTHLHFCNVIHGDLKGQSILVDGSGRARIADFGLATVTQRLGSMLSILDEYQHTARWTAPEILNAQGPFSKEADIFSFAMVTIAAFTGAVPFSNLPDATAMLAVMEGRRPPRPSHPTFTDELWALTQRCWKEDYRLRPEASEVSRVLRGANPPDWKRLISDTLDARERISLIMTIFSAQNGLEMVGHLHGEDAQAFVDIIDKELDNLEPRIRRRCLRYLYRICGRQSLIPRTLEVEAQYDQKGYPLRNGGFADVWMGQHNGREVAVKVLRVYLTSDFEQIRKRFCREVMTWKGLRHPNVLPLLGVTMTENRFVMISEWMVNGSIDEFVKARADADRLKLLRDVARGLVYMHGQGIVHGDLKGANILIDHDGNACLADFSLITIVSDQTTFLTSCVEGGTTQWMSPELLDPDKFGLKESRPTKESDCYALGMVIYEVLSGRKPYAPYKGPAVIRKVLDGESPGRPQGEEGKLFTDDTWRVVRLCWKPQPGDRTTAKAVLLGLKGDPSPSRPTSGVDGSVGEDLDDQSDAASIESSPSIAHHDNWRQAPSRSYSSGTTSSMAPPDGGKLLAPPKRGTSKGGWVGRLTRDARKTFKATTRKFRGP